MTVSLANSVPKKTKVVFRARKESGLGVISDHVVTARGVWYVITRASDKRTFKCRRSQLELVVTPT